MTERYACVCVREFPLQALLRLRPQLRQCACVVMEGDPPLQQVCSLNHAARVLGLVRGMTKVEVETFRKITVLARSVEQEASAKAVLLECASRFSPRTEEYIEDGVFLCVIDSAGTEKLFGPADAAAQNLLSQLQVLAFTVCVAISSNFHAAVVAAKGLAGHDSFQVILPGAEKESLASLPLAVLDMTEEQAEVFSLWGIRTLGMLADLDKEKLIARMGQEGKRLHQLSRGERPHLFHPIETAFTLSEHMELDAPVEVLDALLFVTNVMLEQLIQRASSYALALASVTITLQLEGGAMHARTVRPALPANDPRLWLKLLHLDLEAHPPPATVIAIALQADPGKTSKVQLGLFSPQLPEPARLDVTLARIRAIVGDENAGRAVLRDTHRQGGFCVEPFQAPAATKAETFSAASPLAVQCVRPAEAIPVALFHGQPQSFAFRAQQYTVERAYGPWLTSGDWWKPTLWGCEQWDVVARARSGAVLCCCIVHDVLHHHWQMTALYD